ncbi:RNA methyltransferase [Filimonas effusa]|uniref:RNA methyltransferase n=1 Tax=Filimonas effusa TaxID=2508721 RepID=A0A4Q1CZ34_9BACT|nr:RNA methyltransferase [Filimonas effusa]
MKNNNIIPESLLKALEGIRGFEREGFVQVHEAGAQLTSVRLNPAKQPSVAAPGDWLPIESQVPWCPTGYYLKERPSFTLDPLFHAGTYYVQEASSMFLWQALQQLTGQTGRHIGQSAEAAQHLPDQSLQYKVLDLCAAPGGKSSLLASFFPEGFIVANEVIRTRAAILVENLAKWGTHHVVVTNNDPAHFKPLGNYFDLIVADAPCSGSGMFRKDPAAIGEWSEENVMLCSQRQQRIIADIYPVLKENGLLIYSTCSYSKEENEDMLDWMINEFDLESCAVAVDPQWGIETVESDKHHAAGYRFYPNKAKGEGFFMAVLRKTSGNPVRYVKKNNLTAATKQEIATVANWLNEDAERFFFKQNELILAAPAVQKEHIALLQQHLYLRKAGAAVGTLKGKDLVPDHELALSLLMKAGLPSVAVDKETALQYLRKKEVNITSVVKGWTIVQYEGVNLGWVKVLPGRVNNYYPVEWRILKE